MRNHINKNKLDNYQLVRYMIKDKQYATIQLFISIEPKQSKLKLGNIES